MATPADRPGASRLLHWLASPRWMLAFFVFAFAGALVAAERPDWITAAWVPPLAIFAVSLLAAIATNRRFRRDPTLLGLHLGLLAFVALLALARLTYLDGAVTLTQGTVFDGQLHLDKRGPLHPGGVERLRFANDGFTEDFGPRARWKSTSNRVRWWDEAGGSHSAEIGDDNPLIMDGYRIYTTRNRGYSPVFRWETADGAEQVGTVQLRSHPLGMANDWQLPGGRDVWAMLDLAEPAELQRGQQRPNLGAGHLPHRLVIRSGERREVLEPGQSIDFPEGRLTYIELGSWMGYRVVYDLAMYWLASAAAVVVGCMIAFYARLVRRGTKMEIAGRGEACA